VIEKGTVLIEDGKILAVGEDVELPAHATEIDLSGSTVYPGFFDGYQPLDIEREEGDRGTAYWNTAIRPQLKVLDYIARDDELNDALRKQGITARLVAPRGAILQGRSVLLSTADQPPSLTLLRAGVSQHLRLTVPPGGGRGSYPNSPMGSVALARQAFYDASWYGKAWNAYKADPSLQRPEKNTALEELKGYPGSGRLVIADGINELYSLRADRFAREFNLRLALLGSGLEYRRLEELRRTGRTVILPLKFPMPPNVGTAEVAMDASLRELMHWDLAPENPARLSRSGIPIAFTTHGLESSGAFLGALRKAISRGLSKIDALRALTTTPADLFGVSGELGTIEKGKLASIVVTDGDLFEKKTRITETWVAGERYRIVLPPLEDLRGRWDLRVSSAKPGRVLMEIAGTPEKLSGHFELPAKAEDKPAEKKNRKKKKKKDEAKEAGDKVQKSTLAHLGLSDARFSCVFSAKDFGGEGIAMLSAVLQQERDGSTSLLGDVTWPDGRRSSLRGTRAPKNKSEEKKETAKKKDGKKKEASRAASYEVNFPLGAYGRKAEPSQPALVVIREATVWSCTKRGVIEKADVLFGAGKILALGPKLKVPEGTIVIDGKGKHVTPGIIDCHSHIATDGGINESAQAVTAEVRIGDFINCDDINIYRQLAGGVTTSNILHGSANPIGGQNQVIKMRWGASDEAMKFRAAPQGIKFALGENVKQSNWGDKYTTRYPQTRMGVEQIFRDEFQSAREYRKRWSEWNAKRSGLPPRRDLELDAIVEILQGRRLVHCHSYRQDEILALIRVLDDFDIRIATFQHILEGYKVADAMAKHGAMGSAFADWWAYKFEVYDAIPYNGTLMHQAGVVVSFNSDDAELGRRLNHEAAKATKYGGVPEAEALKFVTLNPARQLRIDKRVGSIRKGLDADLVIWSGHPLSIMSRCEQTWVDGRRYFDIEEDNQARRQVDERRAALIQKVLASEEKMLAPGKKIPEAADLWPSEDIFCTHSHDEEDR
jgi:N-acetylglucosamine-6-phosphate deacetylase